MNRAEEGRAHRDRKEKSGTQGSGKEKVRNKRQGSRRPRKSRGTGHKPVFLPVLIGVLLAAVLFFLLRGCSPDIERDKRETGKTAENAEKTEEIPDTPVEKYGVFLGIDSSSFSITKFEDYDIIVVDVQELSAQQLAQLHLAGHTVYSYLNIGSVEKSRDYFERFQEYFMGSYDNWPDEVWVDVTQEEWQKFVSEELLDRILDKDPEIDGLFLDNFDVYSRISDMENEDMTQDAYDALTAILETYQEEELPVLINGADLFVDRLIREGETGLIRGVNQETVFSRIMNYDLDLFGRQNNKEKETYLSYLKRCREAGLAVFLLEYTTDESLKKEIEQFCMKNSYQFYISEHVDLGFSDK